MDKKCRSCGIIKPNDQFYKKRTNASGTHNECKECTKERVKRNTAANPDRARDAHYRRKYGITLAEFNRMVLSQGSKCACCGTDRPGGKHNQWCVDHDHVTGAVRELLCKDCNIVLGLVEDSPEHLQRLIAYIAKHSCKNSSSSSQQSC